MYTCKRPISYQTQDFRFVAGNILCHSVHNLGQLIICWRLTSSKHLVKKARKTNQHVGKPCVSDKKYLALCKPSSDLTDCLPHLFINISCDITSLKSIPSRLLGLIFLWLFSAYVICCVFMIVYFFFFLPFLVYNLC